MRLLGRLILFTLAVVGSLTLILVGLGLWAALQHRPDRPPERVYLTLDLNSGISDAEPHEPFGRLGLGGALVLKEVLDALDRAAADERVVGLVARLSAAPLGMAHAQELRDAVLRFRDSGKPAILFSESLGEFGAGTVEYYLASAFGQVWLQPSGLVGLTGFYIESPFLRGALDKLGIKPRFAARHEYKTAIDIITETGLTPEARQSLGDLMESWYAQMAEGVAKTRGLAPAELRAAMDRAPLSSEEALEARLVDRLAYWDEIEAMAEGEDAELFDYHDYRRGAGRPAGGGAKLALVYAAGAVQGGESRFNPVSDSAVMGAETIVEALREAAKDADVKAIVLRVDSPGGSYVASDSIWRAVRQARAAGKPVVASMGPLAASGGYFVSMAADRIVAQPGTITGSIGVFAGKLVLDEFWDKLGIAWDEVHIGENAPMWSANRDFSPEAWQRLGSTLDRIYADFVGKAAEARGLGPEDMDRVARGRIWSGAEAQRVGLVDELGGLATAIAAARKLAGIAPDARLSIEQFPKPRDPFTAIVDALTTGKLPGADMAALADLARLAGAAGPLLRQIEAVSPRPGELRLPPMRTAE